VTSLGRDIAELFRREPICVETLPDRPMARFRYKIGLVAAMRRR
jgi:hypothetical protein